jgi:hypothetical protein
MVFSPTKIKKKPEKIVRKPLAAGGRVLSLMNEWAFMCMGGTDDIVGGF